MKLPPFNFQFIQFCFVMTMLGLIAFTVIFGLRGNIPAWLVMVSGQDKPPAAQVQLVKADNWIILPAYEAPRTGKQDAFAKDRKRTTSLYSLSAPELNLIPPLAISLPKPAKQTAVQNLWRTLLSLAGLLAFIAAGFHNNLPRSIRRFPIRLKRLLTSTT